MFYRRCVRFGPNLLEGRRTHRRVLSVIRYPRNAVIYHYPLFWVILMVILLIFIIQNYPNFLLDNFGVSTGTIVVRLFENDYYVSNIYMFFFVTILIPMF